MISLAVKYRPTKFDDVVSQDSIKAILQQQIESKNHKNCYLFTGGAGTVKQPVLAFLPMLLMLAKEMPLKLTRLQIMV